MNRLIYYREDLELVGRVIAIKLAQRRAPLDASTAIRPSNRPQLCEMERRRRAAGEVG